MRLLMVIVVVAMLIAWGSWEEGTEETPVQTFSGETRHASAHLKDIKALSEGTLNTVQA